MGILVCRYRLTNLGDRWKYSFIFILAQPMPFNTMTYEASLSNEYLSIIFENLGCMKIPHWVNTIFRTVLRENYFQSN